MLSVMALFLVSSEANLDEVLAIELIDNLVEFGIRFDFDLFSFLVGIIDGGLVHSGELFGDEVLDLFELNGSFVELVSLVVSDDCFHF